jgi:hypothetical protein
LLASGGVAWSDCNTNSAQTGAASVVFLQGNGDFACDQAAGDGNQTMGPAAGFSFGVGPNGINWSASEQVDKIFVTRTGSGSRCLYEFEPGRTLGDFLLPTNPKDVSGCSDGVDDPPPVLKPIFQLDKRVTLEDPATIATACDADAAANEIDALAPTTVYYCLTISNIGTAPNDAGSLSLTDSMGTPVFPPGFDGILDPDESVTATYSVYLEEEEVRENNAVVSATYSNGLPCPSCVDDDSAIVNVVATCDPVTQDTADATGTVVTAQNQDGLKRCGPKSDTPATDPTSVALLCDDSCELKEECKDNPLSCKQPCKPSKNWTYIDGDETGSDWTCEEGFPGNDRLPLCTEVVTNPGNAHDSTCSAIKNPALFRCTSGSCTYGRNPTIITIPSSGGGDSTGTIYCLLDPGESASLCPQGSFVF